MAERGEGRLHPEGAPGIAETVLRSFYGDAHYEEMQDRQREASRAAERRAAALHDAEVLIARARADAIRARVWLTVALICCVVAVAVPVVLVLWGMAR